MQRVLFALTVFTSVLAHSVPALAQPDEQYWRGDPTAETHDTTYLRLSLGPGYLHSSTTSQGSSLTLKGTGFDLGFAVGGTVAPNLIIYGQFAILSVSDPTFVLDGTTVSGSGSSFDHIGFGPGATYYFMPVNVFISASFLFGRLQIQNNNNDVLGQTDFGAAFRLAVGKEWWVSPQWGLGVALQSLLAWNHDSGESSTFSTSGISVAFSATYN